MGRCLLSPTISSLTICQLSRTLLPCKLAFPKSCSTNSQLFQHGFCTSYSTSGGFCTKAALSEVGTKKEYSKIAADSTGSVPSSELLRVVEAAAKTGAQVWPPSLISLFYFYVIGKFLLKDWILTSCTNFSFFFAGVIGWFIELGNLYISVIKRFYLVHSFVLFMYL